MPIDFAAIAARFAELAFQDRLANTAGRVIEASATKRLSLVHATEVRTRDMPTLQFDDRALAVQVLTRTERGVATASGRLAALVLSLPRSLSGSPTVNVTLGGWDRWLRAATDLPAFIDAADQVLAAADASIDRYAVPTPDVFDPNRRTVFDLVGVAAAFFTTMRRANEPDGVLDQLCKRLKDSIAILRADSNPAASPNVGAPTSPTTPAVTGAPERSDEMDSIALAGALTFLALPRLISTVLTAVDIRVRLLSLEVLQKVERRVRKTIAAVYQKVFTKLRDTGLALLQLVRGVEEVVGAFTCSAMTLVVGVGTGFAAAIRDFVYQLARWLQAVVGLMELVVDLLAFLGFNWSELPKPPPLNVRFDFPGFASGTLFSGDVRRRIGEIIRRTDEGMRSALTGGFGQAANGLQKVADEFSALVPIAIAARPISPTLTADTEALVADLLPAEPTRVHHDRVAQTFESWIGDRETWIGTPESLVAGAGIGVLIAVLHGYAREVARLWHARYTEKPAAGAPTAGRPSPTSPHILRRHTMPGRVQIPRMWVRVGGPPDADTLDEFAAEFAVAVRDAYRQGMQRLSSAAGR